MIACSYYIVYYDILYRGLEARVGAHGLENTPE
jgi:hypothetical protein